MDGVELIPTWTLTTARAPSVLKTCPLFFFSWGLPFYCIETHTHISSTVDCAITYVIFHVYLLNIRGTIIVFFIGADVLGTAGCGSLSSGGTSRWTP